MIQNLTKQEIYEIFNIKEPNCMQYDVVDYILELQENNKKYIYSQDDINNESELSYSQATYEMNEFWKNKINDKIEWLKTNILENKYSSDNDKDVAEYQVNILEEVYNG